MKAALSIELDHRVIMRSCDNSLRHSARQAMDDFLLLRGDATRSLSCSRIEGLGYLQRVLRDGKGAVLISGHFFGNRVAKAFLRDEGYVILSVRTARGWPGPIALREAYSTFLHSVIKDEVTIEDPDCSLKMLSRLRSNGLVDVHIDALQYPGLRVLRPFMGDERYFPTGFLRIAQLSGAPLMPFLCTGDSRDFTVTFGKPRYVQGAEDDETFLVRNLDPLLDELEWQVRERPEYWETWPTLGWHLTG